MAIGVVRLPDERLVQFWHRPPGWLLHVLLAPPALGLLWAASLPGGGPLLLLASLGGLAGVGLVWLARTASHLVHRAIGQGAGRSWVCAVAPVAGIVVLAALWFDVPLRARWELSRNEFEAALREPEPEGRIGLYEIVHARREGDAVFFYEANGEFADDAGFAYLPDGPRPEHESGSFEAPRYTDLGNGWYAWTASW